jgi:hypothetical protein
MESNYIIKQGNIIYPFELEDPNKKYLLNPNIIENEINRIYFRQDIQLFLGSNVEIEKRTGSTYNMELFGEMLSYMNLFLYDDKEYINLYPNGFHTENKVFIPVELFNKMLEQEKIDKESIINKSPVMFIKSLVSVLENLYHLNFSSEEKQKILHTQLKKLNLNNESLIKILDYADNDEDFGKLKFIPTKELKISLLKNDFSPGTVEYLSVSDDSSFIDIVLSKSKELKDDTHPFHKLKSKIVENIDIESNSFSSESIQELVNNISQLNPKDLMRLNSSLSSMAQNIIKNHTDNDPNIIHIVKDLSREWLPSIMKLKDGPFAKNFLDLLKKLNDFDSKLLEKGRQNLAIEMISYESCTEERKELIIGLSTMMRYRRNKIIYVHKEKENNENMFYDACGKGDLETIKRLLNLDNEEISVDISSKNNTGFIEASKKNHTNVLLYLIAGENSKQHIDIKDVWKYIKYRKNIEVFDELLSKNLIDDKKIILDLAFNFEKIDLVNDLLNKKLDREDINKMFDILNETNRSDNASFQMSKIFIDKIMEYPNVKEELGNKIDELFFAAAKGNNLEILRTLVFDYNIVLSDSYKKNLEKHYPQINNFFNLREINKELNLEMNSNLDNKKVKKNKI